MTTESYTEAKILTLNKVKLKKDTEWCRCAVMNKHELYAHLRVITQSQLNS